MKPQPTLLDIIKISLKSLKLAILKLFYGIIIFRLFNKKHAGIFHRSKSVQTLVLLLRSFSD